MSLGLGPRSREFDSPHLDCGCSSMVERWVVDSLTRVRFPSVTPRPSREGCLQLRMGRKARSARLATDLNTCFRSKLVYAAACRAVRAGSIPVGRARVEIAGSNPACSFQTMRFETRCLAQGKHGAGVTSEPIRLAHN